MMRIETPIARASDPSTSHDAADYVTSTGKRAAQQRLAIEAVKCHPGLSSLELAHKTKMCRFMLARRLPECARGGAVVTGQDRRCSRSGRMAQTWWPAGSAEQKHLFPKAAA